MSDVDWRAMFVRYAWLVGEYEGVDFIDDDDWTPEEWDAIWDAQIELKPEHTDYWNYRRDKGST